MKIRRVVTGHDENGKAVVQWDNEVESVSGRPGFSRVEMWATKQLPPVLTDEDPRDWEVGTAIAGGSVFRVIQFDPGVAGRQHVTESIDYALVLSGEIDMELEKGDEVHLKAGDVLIQRATIHNWINRGKEPCVMAFVLLGLEGGKGTGW
jgi:quercetin dioxygenase-like cupin family protein